MNKVLIDLDFSITAMNAGHALSVLRCAVLVGEKSDDSRAVRLAEQLKLYSFDLEKTVQSIRDIDAQSNTMLPLSILFKARNDLASFDHHLWKFAVEFGSIKTEICDSYTDMANTVFAVIDITSNALKQLDGYIPTEKVIFS